MDTRRQTQLSFKELSSQPCWGNGGRTTSPKLPDLTPAHGPPFLSGTEDPEKGQVSTGPGPCEFCGPQGILGPYSYSGCPAWICVSFLRTTALVTEDTAMAA